VVKLNKIYTRTGDTGQTGLADGSRCAKYDLRVVTYGDVDEANAAIGIARLYVENREHDEILKRIQHDLFDLGADLSTPAKEDETKTLRVTDTQVTRLEKEIDMLNAPLSPLNSFVLPGGTKAAAFLHQARTVVRRAERLACALAEKEDINFSAIRYLNRLSDLLFVLSRAVNENGAKDVLWEPGVNR
jgi:cob(I)alamin adenosyltransferase